MKGVTALEKVDEKMLRHKFVEVIDQVNWKNLCQQVKTKPKIVVKRNIDGITLMRKLPKDNRRSLFTYWKMKKWS